MRNIETSGHHRARQRRVSRRLAVGLVVVGLGWPLLGRAQEPEADASRAVRDAEALQPVEDLDLRELLSVDVRGGQAGSYASVVRGYSDDFEAHAYLSVEFKLPLPTEDGTATFDLHHAVVMLSGSPWDWLQPELSLEWEHAGTEFYVPWAFADAIVTDELIVRAGLFASPVGAFNEYQYPDFLRLTVRQPMFTRSVVPSLWSEVGIQLRGRSEELAGLNYALFVSNGLEQGDPDPDDDLTPEGGDIRQMRFNDRDTNDIDKAFGGRVGLSPTDGLNFGLSGYTGAYTVDGERRLTILDADLSVQLPELLLRAEGAIAWQEVTDETLIKWGAYLLGAYRVIPELQPYLQLDVLSLGDAADDNRQRVQAGIAIYPSPAASPRTMVKIEGSVTRDDGDDVTGELISQFTLTF